MQWKGRRLRIGNDYPTMRHISRWDKYTFIATMCTWWHQAITWIDILFIITKVPWHWSEDVSMRRSEDNNQWNETENSFFVQIASISPRGQWFPAHYYFNKINVDSSWYVTLWQAHRQQLAIWRQRLTVVVSINLTCPLQNDIKSVSRVWSNSLYQPSAGSTSMTLELNKIKNEKYRKKHENIVCKMTFFVHDSMC